MTSTETQYVDAYCDAIRNVGSGLISNELRDRLDELEAKLSKKRVDQLRDVARMRLGIIS